MQINYFGPGDPLALAFLNTMTGDTELEVVSLSATQVVVRNPSNGVVTTILGTNLPTTDAQLDVANPPGTVTGWRTATSSDQSIATVQNISWTTAEFLGAIVQLIEEDNDAPLVALVSRQPVTLDASNAVAGSQSFAFGSVSSVVTILASPGPDILEGGTNSDTITVVNNVGNGDTIYATPGNDRYIFQPSANDASWVDLVYRGLTGPITVTINGPANTGSIVKAGQGTDTLTNVQSILDWDAQALNIWGTAGNDSFTINGGAETWMRILGGAGRDSYNLTMTGDMRLSLGMDWDSGPTSGVVVNLATETISNDGFGNAETLVITEGAGNLELETSDLADNIIGSAGDDRFIGRGGNDTINGGDGFDRLRFDRSQATSGVTVDLDAGTATGTWRGTAFTKQLTSIEYIRGTELADQIRGSAVDERLEGRAGNDLLDGRGGDDVLLGQDGDDTLIGGAGNDTLDGGAGNDRIEVGSSTFIWGEAVIGSAGNDTIVYSGVNASGGGWNDLVYANYESAITVAIDGAANTGTVTSSFGNDTLVDVARVLADVNDGFSIFGSDVGTDRYTINGGADSWVQIFGGAGVDLYTLTLSGIVRLNFSGNWNDWLGATDGLQINLATGVIANDGYGNAETITILGGTSRLEINGTLLADTMIGSDRGENFISGGGNDTISGGGGFDTVRYDRSDSSAGLSVNLATGVATGAWNGTAFTQQLTGIEEIRGTSFADVMRGTAGNERFVGGGGNDLLVGDAGNDTLEGSDGTDTLNGGDGDDFIYGGATAADLRDLVYGGNGNDYIDGGDGNDELNGGNGNDTVIGNFGSDTLIGNDGNDVFLGAGGSDLIFGNDGNDYINGGFGYDRLNGGTGADVFFHQGVADHGSDWIQDYNAAEGDVLSVGLAGATRSQFQVNFANTAGAGAAGVTEAFIIYRPTGQILWALVDGGDDTSINLSIGGQVFDLLA